MVINLIAEQINFTAFYGNNTKAWKPICLEAHIAIRNRNGVPFIVETLTNFLFMEYKLSNPEVDTLFVIFFGLKTIYDTGIR